MSGGGEGGLLSGRLAVGRLVVGGPEPPHSDAAVVGRGEDVRRVGRDRVDRRVVRLHLTHQVARVGRPQLKETTDIYWWLETIGNWRQNWKLETKLDVRDKIGKWKLDNNGNWAKMEINWKL